MYFNENKKIILFNGIFKKIHILDFFIPLLLWPLQGDLPEFLGV